MFECDGTGKKKEIFKVILDNKELYTVNNNGVFIDYLKLTDASQKAILAILNL